MGALLFVALALAGVATALAIRAATINRLRTARVVARIGAYGRPTDGQAPDMPRSPLLGRAIERAAGRLGRVAAARLGQTTELRTALLGAGLYRTSPAQFLGYRVLAVVVAGAASVWVAEVAHPGALLLTVIAAALLAAAWFLPGVELKRRRQVRLARLDRQLPDLIDFLAVTVEAGIGFSAALGAAAKRFPAPVGDELRLTAQEQTMGLSTQEALRNLLRRCETPSTSSFVRSLVQGETLGVSVGQILRGLSVEMRKRRRQAAEEQAQKAPLKMLFPLALLIFPALFLVLLGPAAYQILQTFGGR